MPSEQPPKPPSFTCPRCGAVSFNPKDIIYGYCGACHDFTRPRVVDYPSIISPPSLRDRTDRATLRKQFKEITEILRQVRVQVMWPHGHGLYRAVYGREAPVDHRFTWPEIDELCKRYLKMHKKTGEEP